MESDGVADRMNRIIKAVFLGVISFLLISAGILIPLGFNFYQSGQARLSELQRQIENRGSELSLALARLATEQWGPRGMVSVSSAMNEVVAYDGFPTRYPHWRFGMAYEEIQKSHAYGLRHIYEIVINNDPCYAYLMKSNNMPWLSLGPITLANL